MNQNSWRGSNPPFLPMTATPNINEIEQTHSENAVYLTNEIHDPEKRAQSGADVLLRLKDSNVGLTYKGKSRPVSWLRRIVYTSAFIGISTLGTDQTISLLRVTRKEKWFDQF